MKLPRLPATVIVLGIAYVAVAAWSATWPDHPLTPDERIAKVMVDSVATNLTPLAYEPITDYRSGAFVPEPYNGAFSDHRLRQPPVGVGVAYEQGLLGPKVGRAITLAIGLVAVAYLAWRLGGETTGMLAGVLYLTHPAVLYFHGTYFTNMGGTILFVAAVALLEASRRWPWLAVAGAFAGMLALTFRVEYGVGLFAMACVGALPGPLRSWRGVVGFYGGLGAVAAAVVAMAKWAPDIAPFVFKSVDPSGAVKDPWSTLLDAVRTRMGGSEDGIHRFWTEGFLQNANDYLLYFFPLVGMLAVAGLFTRFRRETAWVFIPLGAQALVMAYAFLPTWIETDVYYGKSWLEASMVRYFLVLHVMLVLLASLALGGVVEQLRNRLPGPGVVAPVAVALLVGTASVAHALQAEHGIAWANAQRDWYDRIEAAAEDFGAESVVVGLTTTKVVTTRPVLSPFGVGHDAGYMVEIARDLIGKGHRVFALEPWFWSDQGFPNARAMLHGGHTYWTYTGVQVDCTCGEAARFYELHLTNATLTNVERLNEGHFEEVREGLRSIHDRSFFWEERSIHIAHGRGDLGPVTVRIEYWDGDRQGHEAGFHRAGYLNLPVTRDKNAHTLLSWEGSGSNEWRNVTFTVPRGEIVNGPYFVSKGLLIRTLEVKVE